METDSKPPNFKKHGFKGTIQHIISHLSSILDHCEPHCLVCSETIEKFSEHIRSCHALDIGEVTSSAAEEDNSKPRRGRPRSQQKRESPSKRNCNKPDFPAKRSRGLRSKIKEDPQAEGGQSYDCDPSQPVDQEFAPVAVKLEQTVLENEDCDLECDPLTPDGDGDIPFPPEAGRRRGGDLGFTSKPSTDTGNVNTLRSRTRGVRVAYNYDEVIESEEEDDVEDTEYLNASDYEDPAENNEEEDYNDKDEPSKTEKAKKRIPCGICSKRFKSQGCLRRHLTRAHEDKGESLTCPVCDEEFYGNRDLKAHVEKNHPPGTKGFACKVCGRAYFYAHEVKRHARIHTDQKPFKCTQDGCRASFSLPKYLARHMHSHDTEKPFVCEDCGQRFSLKENLHQHRKVHSGVKPFMCEQCSDCFARKATLVDHMKTHTKEKSFACDACNKSFSLRSGLRRHAIIHSGVKEHMCELCGKRFVRLTNLKQHRSRASSCVVTGKGGSVDKMDVGDSSSISNASVMGRMEQPEATDFQVLPMPGFIIPVNFYS